MRAGARIVVGPRTIVTPAARDAGATAEVFVWLSGPRDNPRTACICSSSSVAPWIDRASTGVLASQV